MRLDRSASDQDRVETGAQDLGMPASNLAGHANLTLAGAAGAGASAPTPQESATVVNALGANLQSALSTAAADPNERARRSLNDSSP